VVSGEPFHWITEHGWNCVPVTFRVNWPDPAIALEGAIAVAAGAGSVDGVVTEKFKEFDTAEPFETVIAAVPALTVSANGTSALS